MWNQKNATRQDFLKSGARTGAGLAALGGLTVITRPSALAARMSACASRLGPHLRVAEKIRSALRAFRVQGQMEIVIRRCLFHPEDYWGYALTIFVHGYGARRSAATREWTRAVQMVGRTLARVARSFGGSPSSSPNVPFSGRAAAKRHDGGRGGDGVLRYPAAFKIATS